MFPAFTIQSHRRFKGKMMRVYQIKGWITPPTFWGWFDLFGFWFPQVRGKWATRSGNSRPRGDQM